MAPSPGRTSPSVVVTWATMTRQAWDMIAGVEGALEEQKDWLQNFLNREFEREGWSDGSIAWQDVAKRKSDLSNNDIFQARHNLIYCLTHALTWNVQRAIEVVKNTHIPHADGLG